MKEELIINEKLKIKLTDLLLKDGLTELDVLELLKLKYYRFVTSDEIPSLMSPFLDDKEYLDIIDYLSFDYDVSKIEKFGISKEKIESFENIVNSLDLTDKNVRTLSKFNFSKNMIIAAKKGLDKSDILEKIKINFVRKMKEENFDNRLLDEIYKYIVNIDYSLPLYKNLNELDLFLEKYELEDKYLIIIKNSIRNLDNYYQMDEIIEDMNKILERNIDKSIILYKVVKTDKLLSILNSDIDSSIGKKIDESSYLDANIFIDEDNLLEDESILEIYVPKNTQGIFVNPFSEDKNEESVLLNNCELYVISFDKNKIKVIALSKDKKCYKNIDNMVKDGSYNNYKNQIRNIFESKDEDSKLDAKIDVFEDLKKYKYTINNKDKVLFEELLDFDKDSEEDVIQSIVIDYLRRNPVDKDDTFKSNDIGLKSVIMINSKNNNTLIIKDISSDLANKINELVTNTKADLYYKKRVQQSHIQNSDSPLSFLRLKRFAGGFINTIIITLMAFIIGLIVAIFMFFN